MRLGTRPERKEIQKARKGFNIFNSKPKKMIIFNKKKKKKRWSLL